MSNYQTIDPGRHSVVSIIKHAVQRSGLWNEITQRTYYLVISAVIIFLATLSTQVVALFLAAGDTRRLFECFSVLTFCGMGALKLKSLYSYKHSWLQLLSRADHMENHQLKADAPDIEYESDGENNSKCFTAHIKCYTDTFNSLAAAISRIYMCILIIFTLTPFLEWGYWKMKGVEMAYPHILPGWAPLDEIGISGWAITIISEFIAATYCVFVQIAFDLTAFGLMIFVSGQFVLLREYSERIAGNGKHYELSNKRDTRAQYRIKKCHSALITLEKSVKELDILLRSILGIYFLVAIWTLCSVALRLKSEEMSKMQLVNLLQYTLGVITQLFLFCYYGDKILHSSSVGMAAGPCATSFWCLSPRVRRELLLLAVGMMRVRRLRAGPFNSLDLPSFILIVRAAYSYFAVLQK